MSSYQDYTNADDRRAVNALLKAVMVDGNTASVFDGEEWVIKGATTPAQVKAELASTGEDSLSLRDSDGECIGYFYLIYNNGSEGDPMIVIADYSANDYCDAIWNSLNEALG